MLLYGDKEITPTIVDTKMKQITLIIVAFACVTVAGKFTCNIKIWEEFIQGYWCHKKNFALYVKIHGNYCWWCHWCHSSKGCFKITKGKFFLIRNSFISIVVDNTFTDDCPKIVTKQQWGGRRAVSVPYQIIPVPNVVIHHTVTETCETKSSCSETVKNIQNHHMNELNFDDIGYKYMIIVNRRLSAKTKLFF